jgi:hypothetical protein
VRSQGPRALLRSPALRASCAYGVGGLAFALGNLLLGRSLPVLEFALFSLVLSLVQIGIQIGPVGLNTVIIRHQLEPYPHHLLAVSLTSATVGLVLAVLGRFLYEIGPLLLLLLLVCIIAGAAGTLVVAHYRRERRFGSSLTYTQGPNLVILLAALAPPVCDVKGAWLPCLVVAVGYIAFASSGWMRLVAEKGETSSASPRLHWLEGLTVVGGEAAVALMIQLERLVIPVVLAIEDLATFAVLAAIVGSPFRTLQMGVGHTLLPRLRAAESALARKRILFMEAATVAFFMALTCAGVWFVIPLLVDWVLEGRYTLSPALVLATLISGLAKVTVAFGSTIVKAIGSSRHLHALMLLSWSAVGLGLAGAALGARWGLTGLVYGVGVAWLAKALGCLILASRGLHQLPRESAGSTL